MLKCGTESKSVNLQSNAEKVPLVILRCGSRKSEIILKPISALTVEGKYMPKDLK